jgi:predicted lipoprotein with Yx(FWY)xxD motif
MIDPQQQQMKQSQRRKRPAILLGMAVLAVALSFAAVAFASGTVTVGSATNSRLDEQVVVNAKGRTLYALSPETTKHLLCKTSECLKFWPPLTVPSTKTKLKAGPGVQGHLGILHRNGGVLQVTLRGMPLYRFAKDHAKGEANGQGLESFGGTWHAVTAASTPSTSMAPTSTTPTSTTPTTTTPTTTTPTTTTPTTTTPTTTTPEPPYVY